MRGSARRAPARARSDVAVTLVEVMIALALLAGGVTAAVTVVDRAARAAAADAHRSDALSIAQREMATLRAAPAVRVGLDPGAPGFVSSFEGAQTVVSADPIASPRSTVAESTEFTVERFVTWAQSDVLPITDQPGPYKNLTIVVSWDVVAERSVRIDSAVEP